VVLHFPIAPKLIVFRQPHTNCCWIDLTLLNFFLPMQTKTGLEAKGLTAEEFEVNFKALEKIVRAQQHLHRVSTAGRGRVWLDNARWHSDSQLARPGLCPKVPPYSPDIMKVIEHCWNTIKREFNQRFSSDQSITDITTAAALFEKVAHEVITLESVEKDVATLRDTLKAIVDANGDRIPKRFR
jgi:hypothetical protein